jgi:hypothetical protein
MTVTAMLDKLRDLFLKAMYKEPGYDVALVTAWNEAVERVQDVVDGLTDKSIAMALGDELKRYKDAEEAGFLVRLPCKVGDTLYAPTRNIISEFRVSQFDFGGYDAPYLWVEWYLTKGITGNFRMDGIRASEIGKTVFLSREEAEAALKGETEDV